MHWKQVTNIKHILLINGGWGNFRKNFRTHKLMTVDLLTTSELDTYIKVLKLATTPIELVKLMNVVINHEIKLKNLISLHFNDEMTTVLLTGIYSQSVTEEYAYGKWKKIFNITFPDYGRIDLNLKLNKCNCIRMGQPLTVVINNDGTSVRHMTGILQINDRVYYIDSNAESIPQVIQDIYPNMIRYPTHPVNAKVFGYGQCTIWTVFFAQILTSIGPMDYTKIPPYVFHELFSNYCANMRSKI